MHKNTDDISLNNNFNDDILNTGKKGQKKKNKRKVSISPLTIVLLVTAIISIAANIFLLVTDHTRTEHTVAQLESKDLDVAKASEKEDLLNSIREQFESGSSTLSSCILIILYILTGREIMFFPTLTLPLQKLITAHPDSHAMIMVL